MRRLLIGVLSASAGILSIPALAHGSFVDARPLPGTAVGGVVDEVEFLFPEEVLAEGAVISITASDGTTVPTRGALVVPIPPVARQPIDELRTPGEYRIDYSIPSFDGTVYEGAFVFTYDPNAPALEPLPFGRGDSMPLVLIGLGGLIAFVLGGALIARRRSRPEHEPERLGR
jgi:methionine-rich copper-binding protein CopC